MLLVGGYQEVEVLGCVVDVDLDPADATVEGGFIGTVVVADRGAAVGADICGFVSGEDHGNGTFDSAFSNLVSVHEQIYRSSLA